MVKHYVSELEKPVTKTILRKSSLCSLSGLLLTDLSVGMLQRTIKNRHMVSCLRWARGAFWRDTHWAAIASAVDPPIPQPRNSLYSNRFVSI